MRALTPQQDQEPPIAKPAADGGKLAQPDRQLCIVRANAGVAHRRAVRRNHLARPALAHLIGLADPTVAPCRRSWSIHGGIAGVEPILPPPNAAAWGVDRMP